MTPDSAPLSPPVARGRRALLALAALFFLPVAAAFWMYYGAGWRPGGTINHGTLIDPPRALAWSGEATALRGAWVLVYVGDGACDASCRRALHVMRQTRVALNADMTRVQRLLLATGGCCDRAFLGREHPGLVVLDGTQPELQTLLAAFPPEERAGAIYIVDPLGNLVMREEARGNPQDLLADLRRLLRLSHIG